MDRLRRSARPLLIPALIVLAAATGRATTITGAKDGTGPATSPDGKFIAALTIRPVKYLSGVTDADFTLLTDKYKGHWTFNKGTPFAGTFDVLQYTPFALRTLGGADFAVLYDDKVAAPRTDYDWVQIGHPTNWAQYGSTPFVDAYYAANFPFYSDYTPDDLSKLMTPTSFYGPSIWLNTKDYPRQKIQNPTGGGKLPAGDLIFQDEPYVPYSRVPRGGYSELDLDLYLVKFTWNGKLGRDAGGTITIYDGMSWGVRVFATPEPSTLALAGIGSVVALAGCRLKRWRRGHAAG